MKMHGGYFPCLVRSQALLLVLWIDRQHLCLVLLLVSQTYHWYTEGVVLTPYGMKRREAMSIQTVHLK